MRPCKSKTSSRAAQVSNNRSVPGSKPRAMRRNHEDQAYTVGLQQKKRPAKNRNNLSTAQAAFMCLALPGKQHSASLLQTALDFCPLKTMAPRPAQTWVACRFKEEDLEFFRQAFFLRLKPFCQVSLKFG